MKTAALLLIALVAFTGCTDAEKASLASYGELHRITLYATDGAVIKSWTTQGAVMDIPGDGIYFKDDASGQLVSVRGTLIVEVIKR